MYLLHAEDTDRRLRAYNLDGKFAHLCDLLPDPGGLGRARHLQLNFCHRHGIYHVPTFLKNPSLTLHCIHK